MYDENDLNYIKIPKCKNGYLYKIDSRNLSYGVYCSNTKGFSGIRYKFGNRYIFEEFHFDTGAPFGTVKPQKEVSKCPISIDDQKGLFTWLDEFKNFN